MHKRKFTPWVKNPFKKTVCNLGTHYYVLGASLVVQWVKNPPAGRETWVRSLDKRMTTHSSLPAWRIPMDRGASQATVHGISKSRTQLSDFHTHTHTHIMYLSILESKSLQVFLEVEMINQKQIFFKFSHDINNSRMNNMKHTFTTSWDTFIFYIVIKFFSLWSFFFSFI